MKSREGLAPWEYQTYTMLVDYLFVTMMRFGGRQLHFHEVTATMMMLAQSSINQAIFDRILELPAGSHTTWHDVWCG